MSLKDSIGHLLIEIGLVRILKELFGVMSVVWKNPKIQGSNVCLGSLEKNG